ncbi:hypothetical protein JW979_06390, partial [bacterium]|nr:hypothetical protein [candidate division CSSED10-310 bacterium]
MTDLNIKSHDKKHRKDFVIAGFILGFLFGLGYPSLPGDPGWWYFSTVFFESMILYILCHSVGGGLLGLLMARLIWRTT